MEFEDRCHKVQEPKFDCLLFGKPPLAFLQKCRRPLLSCFCSFPLLPSSPASSRNAKGSDLFLPADLDDTLYPLSSGIAGHVKKNIEDYMVEKLGIDESKIENLGNLLYKNYGTTMAGLRVCVLQLP
jgi:hypothetical protein